MMNGEYNKDYFENGLVKGISCYLNYRWLPELTIKMAHNIIKELGLKNGDKVLDYGCAKGYLVKALRILDINAYGCDISSYAIKNIDTEVRDFCKLIENEDGLIPFDFAFDWIITKDVLEHFDELMLDKFLEQTSKRTKKMFHIIPLGNKESLFVVPDYEKDITHNLAETKEWWIKKFKEFDWDITSFNYSVKGIKENWTEKHKEGNGFFTLKYNG